MKKLTLEELLSFRDRMQIPIPDSDMDPYLPPYYNPGPDDEAMQYMQHARRRLGGAVPSRRVVNEPLVLPPITVYDVVKRGSGNQEVATTMAFVRLLKELMKDPNIGHRFVPIIPDEARTFGMDSLFPTAKIYSPHGQQYLSVDRDLVLAYKESEIGQILHEGINEAGSTASFTAAGSSYATHAQPMIPIYIFYSMFGFQRTGDGFWAAMDQMARGFVLGATAGRTTLNGEGLQHQDGHSLILSSSIPSLVTYDPAFSYEVALIIADGMKRMYVDNEDLFYYLTLYNENYMMPPMPEGVQDGVLKGLYKYKPSGLNKKLRAHILGSGPIIREALRAQEILEEKYGVSVDVWSATSYKLLRNDALNTKRWNMLHPTEKPRKSYLETLLAPEKGVFVAVSDNMKMVPDQIAPWVPGGLTTLGTDGYGRSDTRKNLRRFFEVDAECTAVATLYALSEKGLVDRKLVAQAIKDLNVDPEKIFPALVSFSSK